MRRRSRERTPGPGETGRRRVPLALGGLAIFVGVVLVAWFLASRPEGPPARAILASYVPGSPRGELHITYPADGTLFPPEIAAPEFVWEDKSPGAERWFIAVELAGGREVLRFTTEAPHWRPAEEDWDRIKRESLEKDATVTVAGVSRAAPAKILSSARVRVRTSKDRVGDSLFYREVPLPFLSAVRDPSRIRWRFGSIASKAPPPIVLDNLPVCGNCHSFSADGSVLGLDVDFGNDKGAYAILPVAPEMVLNESNIITWADYRREEGDLTFGLLSQVSPDGRYAVSTVKDRSVFVATPGLAFSQLFFPIKGILVVYDREKKTFASLPGADNPELVQSNPSWSPDGRYIVFARARAYRLEGVARRKEVLLNPADVPEFVAERKPFRYDLYRIPFNGGRGGKAEPLPGASNNGMSNFFARYSPDGNWIVFCKARSYMLLQPDSELYIMPAGGGTPRRLSCNTPRMNSWHSWSSNGRWLVFSSKANGPYTQLFLTHIDEEGRDSPAVVLDRMTAPDRAVNIPEFVRLRPGAIVRIHEHFLDDYSFLRAGAANDRTGDYQGAERAYRRGLELNPNNADLHNALGWALSQQGKIAEAIEHLERALELSPKHVKAHNNLALVLMGRGEVQKAIAHYRASLAVKPRADIYSDLGFALEQQGKREEALRSYREALELDPSCAPAHFNLAVAAVRENRLAEAREHYEKALAVRPNAETYNGLGFVLARLGKLEEARVRLRQAIRLNPRYVPAYNNLGRLFARQGKLEEAAFYYRGSVGIEPSAEMYNELGTVLLRQGKREEAVRAFREALRVNPAHAGAQRNLDAALAAGGKGRAGGGE